MQFSTVQESKKTDGNQDDIFLEQIEETDNTLADYFSKLLIVDDSLTRKAGFISLALEKNRAWS